MKLVEIENIALHLLFSRGEELDTLVLSRVDTSSVLEREATGVGFYCTLLFSLPLPEIPEVRRRNFAFNNPAFPHGGVFHCEFLETDIIELEGVSFGGTVWPVDLKRVDLTELTLPAKNASLTEWNNSDKEKINDKDIKGTVHA